jgi:acyl-CoA dehydrogenase
METLTLFATDEQKERWLQPLLEGEIRSAFAMTEPAVASSDATNISCRIERQGDEYVINGRKWWISGAASERCKVFILMGKTDPDAPTYTQQSMVLVPVDTPGVTILRNLPVFGYADRHGHCEIVFEDARVPVSNVLGQQGGGFAIAQARLGPGRIHHCMRTVGVAERALEAMCKRVQSRTAFGKPLSDPGQQGGPHRGVGHQGGRPPHGAAGHRPRHPGPRRRRRQRRLRAGRHVRPHPHAAPGRRAR